MFATAIYRFGILAPFSVCCLASAVHAQVNTAALNNALLNRTVTPTIVIGYQASTANPVMVNGKPAMFPVKTQIFPDGHEFFRIEYGIVRADAAKYTTFRAQTVFTITKIEVKADELDVEMPVSIDSAIPNSKIKASIQLKWGKGWQSSMTTDQALAQIGRYLPDGHSAVAVGSANTTSNASGIAAPTSSSVNLSALNNLLAGKTIYPSIKIASKAISSRLIITANAVDKLPPVITLVFPDGHVEYDAKPGPMGSPADHFEPLPVFDEGLRIGRISASEAYIEVEVLFTAGGTVSSSIDPGHVRFMLGRGWQTTMTTESVLELLTKTLPDKPGLSDLQQPDFSAEQQAIDRDKMPHLEEEAARARPDQDLAARLGMGRPPTTAFVELRGHGFINATNVPKHFVRSRNGHNVLILARTVKPTKTFSSPDRNFPEQDVPSGYTCLISLTGTPWPNESVELGIITDLDGPHKVASTRGWCIDEELDHGRKAHPFGNEYIEVGRNLEFVADGFAWMEAHPDARDWFAKWLTAIPMDNDQSP